MLILYGGELQEICNGVYRCGKWENGKILENAFKFQTGSDPFHLIEILPFRHNKKKDKALCTLNLQVKKTI